MKDTRTDYGRLDSSCYAIRIVQRTRWEETRGGGTRLLREVGCNLATSAI